MKCNKSISKIFWINKKRNETYAIDASTNLKEENYLTKKELEKIKTLHYSNFNIRFFPHKIKYKKPKYSPEICVLKNKTYSVLLYIPLQVKYKNLKLIFCYLNIIPKKSMIYY